jgi:hypothetical protein
VLQYFGKVTSSSSLHEREPLRTATWAPVKGTKWRLERVRNDLDRRLQRLDPLLTIPGVSAFARMAEQIPSASSLTEGEPSGRRVFRKKLVAVCRCEWKGLFGSRTPTTLRSHLEIGFETLPLRLP